MNNKFLAIFFFMNLIKPVKRLLVRNVFVPFKKKNYFTKNTHRNDSMPKNINDHI